VGLSDRPHYRHGSAGVVPSGLTLGARAATDQHLGSDEAGRLDLGDARAGSFRDALNALDPAGRLYADRFDEEVLHPFAHETCLLAADRARTARPAAWAELADDVGEDPADLAAVLHAGEWEVPLRAEAELLVLAALADVPLLDVEAEGVPLSLVRAAEAIARGAAAPADPVAGTPPDLAGALFLAEAAVRTSGLPVPVPVDRARALTADLLAAGLDPDEVVAVLPHLALAPGAAEAVTRLVVDGR
ncbi:MAG: uncharacterized protein JWR82_2222, partial [Blastococcus sp.]|nr:uncharacterized protein [Blastococcus sp.]